MLSNFITTVFKRAVFSLCSFDASDNSEILVSVEPRLLFEPPVMSPDGSYTSPSRVTVLVLVVSQIELAAFIPSTTSVDPNTYSIALRTSSSKPTSSIAGCAVVLRSFAILDAFSQAAEEIFFGITLSRGMIVTRL